MTETTLSWAIPFFITEFHWKSVLCKADHFQNDLQLNVLADHRVNASLKELNKGPLMILHLLLKNEILVQTEDGPGKG